MITKKAQTLKGFRDFLPKEALERQWLANQIKKVFELWGYDPIETPTLEPLEIFAGQIGEDEKLFYKFEDAGGRKVALRYDQTVPTCRIVGQYARDLPIPFKRYQIQPAFRAEKPQKGRFREFLQADADIFGLDTALADAEVIALSLEIYKRLGFKKATALINDRSLLKEIPYDALVCIDKLKKIGEKQVLQKMQNKGIQKNDAKKYLEKVKNSKANERIKKIFEILEQFGVDKSWYKFEPTIIRSFSYSTGVIWEIEIPDFDYGSVLGGERFDKLVKDISGKDIAGVGFGLGFDRTLEAVKQKGLLPKFTTNSKVLISIFSPKLLKNSIKIANLLRRAGINCEIYPDENTKLEKQLKYADKKGIEWVIVVGPDEIIKDEVTVKNLKTGSQEKISAQAIFTKIK